MRDILSAHLILSCFSASPSFYEQLYFSTEQYESGRALEIWFHVSDHRRISPLAWSRTVTQECSPGDEHACSTSIRRRSRHTDVTVILNDMLNIELRMTATQVEEKKGRKACSSSLLESILHKKNCTWRFIWRGRAKTLSWSGFAGNVSLCFDG